MIAQVVTAHFLPKNKVLALGRQINNEACSAGFSIETLSSLPRFRFYGKVSLLHFVCATLRRNDSPSFFQELSEEVSAVQQAVKVELDSCAEQLSRFEERLSEFRDVVESAPLVASGKLLQRT